MRSAVLIGALLLSTCAAQQAGATRFPELQALVEQRVTQGFSGVVLVARGDDLLLFDGFGELGGHRVARDDAFWIASTGKQFAATAIVLLAQRGRLDLDAPLSTFFPEAPADKAGITVRQLLSHTSGIGQSYVSEEQATREAAVAAMLAEPIEGEPGDRFRYSNSNLQLAAAIVEVVSGVPYAAFARANLFEPAQLTSTGFATPDTRVSPTLTPAPDRLQRAYWGEQGAYSSAADLFHWYRTVTSGALLNANSIATLFRPHAQIGEGIAALGWFIGVSPQGRPVRFTRGNEDFGPNSLIYAYPDSDVVIIVLTHAGDANDDISWSRQVHRDIEAALAL